MNSILRKGLFLTALAGAAVVPAKPAEASRGAEALPKAGIEEVLNNCYASDKAIDVGSYLVPTKKGEYLNMAFSNVDEDTFLFIRSGPSRESEWVGKLYPNDAAEIIGPAGEWTKIHSGTVTGYVYTEYITIGNSAEKKAEEIIAEKGDEKAAFSYAESKEEEALRLEEEEKQAREEASQGGQAIVDYACQFIGNPYVWGGTSLTDGADCSGFVQSVYANFGIYLPRTTWEQENVGTAVSYGEALAGDLILYEGHVGIYMGGGQIINAINPARGIGVLPAESMNIKTIRRVIE